MPESTPVLAGEGRASLNLVASSSIVWFRESLDRLTDGRVTDGRVTLQAELRDVIQSASAKGELWTRDWDTVPLPSSLTADGGAAARQAAQAAAAAISAKVPCVASLLVNLTPLIISDRTYNS